MNAVNSAQLFALVWTFTAVCQADGVISVICEDVTGTVGEEVTFSCSVSQKSSECSIKLYKFTCPEKYEDSTFCGQNYSCEQINNFTCKYTPTTAMTERFRFFVQPMCGSITTEFTVNIREATKPKTVSEAPPSLKETSSSGESRGEDTGSHDSVVAAVVGCLIIIILILIIITIIYKRKSNSSTPRGVQKWMFLGRRHDDNSNFQEQIPENVIHITDSTV